MEGIFEKALSELSYQDATMSIMDMAESGDEEMKQVVFERVERQTGERPGTLEEARKIMEEWL